MIIRIKICQFPDAANLAPTANSENPEHDVGNQRVDTPSSSRYRAAAKTINKPNPPSPSNSRNPGAHPTSRTRQAHRTSRTRQAHQQPNPPSPSNKPNPGPPPSAETGKKCRGVLTDLPVSGKNRRRAFSRLRSATPRLLKVARNRTSARWRSSNEGSRLSSPNSAGAGSDRLAEDAELDVENIAGPEK